MFYFKFYPCKNVFIVLKLLLENENVATQIYFCQEQACAVKSVK
jgi:hypothetical protein